MINLIKSLFSSEGSLLKAGIAGADALVLTEEEKRDWFVGVMKAYEPFKKAQRLLALTFCIPYALAWLTTFVASFFTEVAEQLSLLNGDIAIIVGLVMTFYFGGGFVESFSANKKVNK